MAPIVALTEAWLLQANRVHDPQGPRHGNWIGNRHVYVSIVNPVHDPNARRPTQ
jgi:hypothetical protein